MMLGVQLAELLGGAPQGVDETLGLITGFDDVLVHGFARIGAQRGRALAEFVAALDASPLGAPATEALAKVSAGSVGQEQLSVLAGGRSALLGAVHDALLTQLDTAIGRKRAPWQPTPKTNPSPGTETTPAAFGALIAARAWLQEVAIAGWRGVNHELVSGADRPLEGLLPDPALRRAAVILDGLAAELRSSCPVGSADRIPVRRWADLWMRAVLLTHGSVPETPETVSGRLMVLGVDVLEHGTAAQIQIHAVLESANAEPRLVRTSVTAAKTDTVTGPAVWRLFTDYPILLSALAENRSIDIRDVPLSANGHLPWPEQHATLGEPADPFATARILLPTAIAPAVAPLDRHPVQISEPVLIEGYQTDGDVWKLGGNDLAAETDRLPTSGPLTPALLRTSSACIGLIRWDAGQWRLRPLAVQTKVKAKIVQVHGGAWALGPTDPKVVQTETKSGDPLAVLRERAGRLLRK